MMLLEYFHRAGYAAVMRPVSFVYSGAIYIVYLLTYLFP